MVIPPPPLQRQLIIQEQEAEVAGGPDVLFDMMGMPPMPGYDMQYVTDPNNSGTYVKLN